MKKKSVGCDFNGKINLKKNWLSTKSKSHKIGEGGLMSLSAQKLIA